MGKAVRESDILWKIKFRKGEHYEVDTNSRYERGNGPRRTNVRGVASFIAPYSHDLSRPPKYRPGLRSTAMPNPDAAAAVYTGVRTSRPARKETKPGRGVVQRGGRDATSGAYCLTRVPPPGRYQFVTTILCRLSMICPPESWVRFVNVTGRRSPDRSNVPPS